MKQLFNYFPSGSPMRVVLHGRWAASRGRALSATYGSISNPRLAMRKAEMDLGLDSTMIIEFAESCAYDSMEAALKAVGLRLIPVAVSTIPMNGLRVAWWCEWGDLYVTQNKEGSWVPDIRRRAGHMSTLDLNSRIAS